MRKYIAFIFIILMMSTLSFSQKAKKHDVSFNYMRFADKPLPKWVKTYAIDIKSTSQLILVGGPVKKALDLKGFKEAEKFNDADVQILFEIDGGMLTADIGEKSSTVKKDDREIKITKYYYYVNAKPKGSYKIKLKNGEIIYHKTFKDEVFEYQTKSDLFSKRSEAVETYKKLSESLAAKTKMEAAKLAAVHYGTYSNEAYGYYYAKSWEKISSGKGKNLDYSDLDGLVVTFKKAAELYSQKNYEEYNQLATECIAGWEKALTEFNPNDKKAAKKGRINVKIADRLYFNIAAAYLYMNEFDKANFYVGKGLEIDKSVWGNALKRDINTMKKRFDKNELRKQEKLQSEASKN